MKSPQSDELKDFLLSRQQRLAENEIDWEERRRQWIEDVERLYEKVTGELLSDSIAQGLVTVSRVDKAIEEEYLGKYRISELILNISGETCDSHRKGATSLAQRAAWIWWANSMP